MVRSVVVRLLSQAKASDHPIRLFQFWLRSLLGSPHLALLLILALALLLRVLLWGQLPRQGMISDEAEYLAAAEWLVQGRGFSWHQGWLWTRAPLYPLFLAGHIRLFGLHLEPIYASQTLLSLLNVVLVYGLARPLDDLLPTRRHRLRRPSVLAALLMAVYLPFAVYPQMLLSETIFVSLLLGAAGLLLLAARSTTTRRQLLFYASAGAVLGLATLTRGLTLGFVPLLALWIWWWQGRHTAGKRLLGGMPAAAVLLLATSLVIAPWSIYASRAYGGPIVIDTTGGFNLLLGARTAYDGKRDDAPTREFVQALLDPRLSDNERRTMVDDACLYQRGDPRLAAALAAPVRTLSQADRQQLMIAEGFCLIRAVPAAFVAKSLAELYDFFRINYTGAERLSSGFALGWLPYWWSTALLLLDDTIYIVVLPLAVLGLARLLRLAPETRRPALALLAGLIVLWWTYNLVAAPLLFAINRFRLPLLPFAFICAPLALQALPAQPATRRRWPRPALLVAVVLWLIAAAPHAYAQAAPASLASYFGPYPSSLVNTLLAWQTRPAFQQSQALMRATGSGDIATAERILAADNIPDYSRAVAGPLLLGLAGQPEDGLELLASQPIKPLERWQGAVVRGDLLRRLGDEAAARAAFTPTYVDDANPVEWAWNWLAPPPTDGRIDLAGNLDLGYIAGFYLGEGDPSADGTFRWSGPEAWLRFPAAGSTSTQEFCLRADGRGWYDDLSMPTFRFAVNGEHFASFELQRSVDVYCAALPPGSAGADLLIHMHSDVFVPDAADLLAQQGPQVGQLRLLGIRLDWVEIRGP